MKQNKVVVILTLATIGCVLKAQDPVVMTINNRPVKKSEFEAVYHKNSGKESLNNTKTVKEYVDLFSLFKSKVFEAESLGLDTVTTFRNELAGYRRQLAAPYLTDKNTNESVLNEAYERMKYEVRASHILMRVDETSLPKDTLEAWTRANLIRNALLGKYPSSAEISNYDKLLKNSVEVSGRLKAKDSTLYKIKINAIKNLSTYSNQADKFPAIAPKTSDDPSVLDNKGDLNYFSAFDMVFPFESAAYNTKVGDVSNLVRTKFGYHIVKVYDKRINRGEMTAAHIMVKFPKEAAEQDKTNAKTKIDELYGKLNAGQSFEELARQFSDDKQSAEKGGQLPPFKSGRLAKPFEDAAFALKKNNDLSEPVKTAYGWHIIKRIDLKSVPEFKDIKSDLKNRVARDSRSQMGRVALIQKVKKENNFKENLKVRDEFASIMDTTYLKATWKAERAAKFGNKEMFSIGNAIYTQNDFAKFLETQMSFRSSYVEPVELMKGIYKTWVEERVVAYEDAQLEKKYTDFSNLYREYRDGILLFDLTDQKVWSKAVKDTAGLRAFYEQNKGNYLWGERSEVTTYKCLNEKVAKEVRKMLKEKKDEKQITEGLNKTSQLNVSVENVTYLKGESKSIDDNWKEGVAPKDVKDEKENKVLVIVINKIISKSPKTLGECRGSVTADYQNYLDTEWLAYLKGKYSVKVNEDVLGTIK